MSDDPVGRGLPDDSLRDAVPDPDRPLAYTVVRSRRRSLALHILPDGTLEVRAPLKYPVRDIHAFVASKRDWVLKMLSAKDRERGKVLWRDDRPPADGDVVRLRGAPFRLSFTMRQSRTESPETISFPTEELPTLRIPVSAPGPAHASALQTLYRKDLERRVRARLPDASALVGARPVSIAYRMVTSRWGSCSPSGRISLNILCAALPDRLLDYVLVHELCHLVHLDHGRGFWSLCLRVQPDCEQRRRELRGWYLR